ncbi:hypothetical protein [Pseudoxanthomonas putridarboris]|uniref:Meckel syndrome type 1 protein n=1 Tax=Pseudoxanthomonas putridarboris TaxID=752605 RepID=A0ABU9IX48_9GAMM
MPDSRIPNPLPRDWSDAFAALPLETPPPDAWAALSARLPPRPAGTPVRQRRLRRIALAAALALAALLPAWWLGQPAPTPADPAVAIRATAPDSGTVPASSLPPAPDAMTASAVADPPARVVTMPVEKAPRATHRDVPAIAAAAPSDPLDALYAESAQLEAVLAQLPEARMANAAAEALSAGLHDRVASIDVALSQPALPSDTQADLWRRRVDALRQLTGVETTQRWQLARGDVNNRPDTAIY